jgi:hypothetical protein
MIEVTRDGPLVAIRLDLPPSSASTNEGLRR